MIQEGSVGLGWVSVHIQTHTQTYIHTYIHTHIIIYTSIHRQIDRQVASLIHKTNPSPQKNMHTHSHKHEYIEAHTQSHTHRETHTFTYIHIRTHIHINTHIDLNTHICRHTHTHTHTLTHTHTHVDTHRDMHISHTQTRRHGDACITFSFSTLSHQDQSNPRAGTLRRRIQHLLLNLPDADIQPGTYQVGCELYGSVRQVVRRDRIFQKMISCDKDITLMIRYDWIWYNCNMIRYGII